MKDSSWKQTVYTLVIALVIGGTSGVLGTAWTSSYLSDYALELSELTAPLRLSQERPRNFPSSYKEAVDRFVENALPSVAEVYQGTPGPSGFSVEDRTHVGVVLTSDGWIGIPAAQGQVSALKQARIRIRSTLYSVQTVVYDSATKMMFVKVDATSLPVAAFGSGRQLQLAEQLFVAQSASSFVPASVQTQIWPKTTLWSSDEPNRRVLLNETIESGSVVFDLNGDVVGMADTDQSVLPMEAVAPALKSLLEKQTIARASLGVQFVDLSHAIVPDVEAVRGSKSGAWLMGAQSVERKGPAALAGVQAGDIIQSVNGELLSGGLSLDELIAQYRPGDQVQLVLDRAGESLVMTVTLGERAE